MGLLQGLTARLVNVVGLLPDAVGPGAFLSLIVLIAFVLVFALISSYPPGILFGLFLAYAASGYVMWVLRWKRRKDKRASAMAPAAPAPQADGREPPAAADDDASPRS